MFFGPFQNRLAIGSRHKLRSGGDGGRRTQTETTKPTLDRDTVSIGLIETTDYQGALSESKTKQFYRRGPQGPLVRKASLAKPVSRKQQKLMSAPTQLSPISGRVLNPTERPPTMTFSKYEDYINAEHVSQTNKNTRC